MAKVVYDQARALVEDLIARCTGTARLRINIQAFKVRLGFFLVTY